MAQRWIGPSVVAVILASVAAVLALNLNWKGWGGARSSNISPEPAAKTAGAGHRPPAGFREYPIGEEVEKNQMRIAAVYLPPVEMEGMAGPTSPSLIHLEADIHATEGNRNGFPKDEFVPYLIVKYVIEPMDAAAKAGSAGPIRGPMMPMIGARRVALWCQHRNAPFRPLQAHLFDCDRAGPPRRPSDRRRALVETVRGLIRLGLSRPSEGAGLTASSNR